MALESVQNQIDIRDLSVEVQDREYLDITDAITPEVWEAVLNHLQGLADKYKASLFMYEASDVLLLDPHKLGQIDMDKNLKRSMIEYVRSAQNDENLDCFNYIAMMRQLFPGLPDIYPTDPVVELRLMSVPNLEKLFKEEEIIDLSYKFFAIRLLYPNDLPTVFNDEFIERIKVKLQTRHDPPEPEDEPIIPPHRWAETIGCWSRFRVSFPEHFNKTDIPAWAWEKMKEAAMHEVYRIVDEANAGKVDEDYVDTFTRVVSAYRVLTAERIKIDDCRILLTMPNERFDQAAPPPPRQRKF